MHRRDLGIGAAVVVAAVLMVTAGFEIGSRARARQSASSSGAPAAAPASTVAGTDATSGTDAGSGAPVPGRSTTGTGGPGGPGSAGPTVGAPVPASGRLLAAPPVRARVVARSGGLACAQLQVRVTGLVPTACGRASLAPSGRPVVWVSGRAPGSRALGLQVWSPTGSGTWERSLAATEPRAGRTWAAIRVATPALSAGGRTLLAQFRSQGPGALLAYDLVGFPGGGPPAVVAHRDHLAHGTVRVTVTATATGTAVLDDYAARSEAVGEPPGGAASGSLVHTRIGLVAGSFRYLAHDRVSTPGP
jgi:hypothetical protein